MKTDTLSRRLRFAPPNALVRQIALAEADYLIFEAINRHGPLPTHYLYEFTRHLRKNYLYLQHRLTELYNGDAKGSYLVRPEQQHAGYMARYQHIVYDLAPRARQALLERGLAGSLVNRKDPFLHQLMQACVGASLEIAAPTKALRYIGRDEIFHHAKCPPATRAMKNPMALPIHGFGDKATLIPDDLFGFQLPDGKHLFYAVEIDRNTESIERKNLDQSSFGRKVAAYLQVLREKTHRSHWGIPNLSVLTVTTNATHAVNLLDNIRKQVEPKYQEFFAVASEPDFGVNWRVPKKVLDRLLKEPWRTPAAARDIAKP